MVKKPRSTTLAAIFAATMGLAGCSSDAPDQVTSKDGIVTVTTGDGRSTYVLDCPEQTFAMKGDILGSPFGAVYNFKNRAARTFLLNETYKEQSGNKRELGKRVQSVLRTGETLPLREAEAVTAFDQVCSEPKLPKGTNERLKNGGDTLTMFYGFGH